ncbi:MAG: hypothetical protein WB565_10385 [Acidimicrobiales bacterium]
MLLDVGGDTDEAGCERQPKGPGQRDFLTETAYVCCKEGQTVQPGEHRVVDPIDL